jgi:integrase
VAALSDALAVVEDVDPYERFLLELLRDAGMRPGDVHGLRRSDADRRNGCLHIRAGKGRGQGKRREIPVDAGFFDRWEAHCERYGIAREGIVCFSRPSRLLGGASVVQVREHDHGRAISTQAVRKTLRRVQQQLEPAIPVADRPRYDLTPKVLRRTNACTNVILHSLGLGGLDLVSLPAAMGHERLDTTQVYLSDVASYLARMRQPINVADGAATILASLRAA